MKPCLLAPHEEFQSAVQALAAATIATALLAPVAQAGGAALTFAAQRAGGLARCDRLRLWTWLGMTTAGLAIVAALPVAAEAFLAQLRAGMESLDPDGSIVRHRRDILRNFGNYVCRIEARKQAEIEAQQAKEQGQLPN